MIPRHRFQKFKDTFEFQCNADYINAASASCLIQHLTLTVLVTTIDALSALRHFETG